MNKNAIVSFANEKGYYVKNMARLSESLRNNFDGDFLGFVGDKSLNCESHSQNPYAFKIAAIKAAKNSGYKNILWLDSSCFAIKHVKPVFDEINDVGFIFQEAGHLLGNYCNDFTLNYFGLTRDVAMGIRMIGNAGFLGLNFENNIANTFFNKWEAAMMAGCFKGNWNNNDKTESNDPKCLGHRHDMSCSSAIVHIMGLSNLMKAGDQWLQYAGIFDQTANDTIIFKAQG